MTELRRNADHAISLRVTRWVQTDGVLPQPFHCTLAVTPASVFSVKAQVLVLLFPLEHAPDQIADLPFETERVMFVPEANDACAALPTLTRIPAGLEVTVSPLRPVALTVKTKVGGAAGFTNRGASCCTPPAVAKTVSPTCVVTTFVGTEKEILV